MYPRTATTRNRPGIVRVNHIARIVVGSGSRRHVFPLASTFQDRQPAGGEIKRFLFPSPGGYAKAKRRGERALSAVASRGGRA